MQNLCYHPWVGLDITPQGQFKPCCKYQNDIDTTLAGYLNSTELTNLKKDFTEGKRPQACKRCWDDEDAGLPSKRQLDWEYIFHKQDPGIDSLKVLSLPFGNSCNLACRTCSSLASSGWISEARKLKQHLPDIEIFKHQKFYQDKNFIDEIKEKSSNLLHVEFPGGEPFLAGIDEHLDFLDYLINNGSDTISLHYMTNATIFPKKEFWDRWKKFKKVDIQLSIDGIEEKFEYLRWPGKWQEVNENIKLFTAITSPNLQISVSHTVSIFNIFYLPEFIKWCLQNKLGKPYLGPVVDPTWYSIKVLPKSVKSLVRDKLDRFILPEIVSYMNSENLINGFDDTIKYIKILDQHRNQNFSETFPEFYQLLKEAKCQI
jgi:MoaA/NifB/PqqE/SkfB family radical SAM enzyme